MTTDVRAMLARPAQRALDAIVGGALGLAPGAVERARRGSSRASRPPRARGGDAAGHRAPTSRLAGRGIRRDRLGRGGLRLRRDGVRLVRRSGRGGLLREAVRARPDELVVVALEPEAVARRDLTLEHLEGLELELDHLLAGPAAQVIVVVASEGRLVAARLAREDGRLEDARLREEGRVR